MQNPWTNIFGNDWLNTDLPAGYSSMFGGEMRGPNLNYNRWLQGQQGIYGDQFKAAIAGDPNLTWLQFLGQQDPQSQFAALAPQFRGESVGQYSPRVKFNSYFGM